MAGSTVELFSTSILSNVKVRTRHERYTSVLAIKKVPYIYHDLASDDDAKSRWRRKAKDPQLPGILVNNEWVGSYDDFEEAVEFGELELFLGVSPAAALTAPTEAHPAQSAVSSKDPSLYPTLPYAAEGAGRWKEADADQFISSLNIKEDDINDADVDALLADIGKLPAQPASTSEKKYVPSKEAAIKPLRLAKMGPMTSHQRMPSGSPSPSASTGSRASPIARYSATQRSTRALAAEAAALTSNRKTSGALLRDAVSQGKTLDDAMEESRMKHIVSQDNIDDLFASLGLSNVEIGDDEVDQFLEQGAIPQGLRLGGDRVNRPSSIADKARDEAVARDLALKAREKGHGSARTSLTSDSAKLTGLQPASQIGSISEDGSAETSTVFGRTSALSTQVSTNPEASSETPDAEQIDVSKTDLSKAEEAQVEVPVSQVPKEVSVTEGEIVNPLDSVVSESSVKESSEASLARESQESEIDPQTAETKAEAAAQQVANPSSSASSVEPFVTGGTDSTATAAESLETTATVPSADVKDVAPEPNTITTKPIDRPAEDAIADAEPDRAGEQDNASNSQDDDTPSSSTPPMIVDEPKETLTDAEDGGNDSQSHLDQDRTPTKEVSEDPIKVGAETTAASESVAKDESPLDDNHEMELAQAALIASKYEKRKSELPNLNEPAQPVEPQEAEVPGSKSVSSQLDFTSPTKSIAAVDVDTVISPIRSPLSDDTKKGESESPLRLGVGSTLPSSSRQASSSSISSSRRAIDVSRPIDPATSPPLQSSNSGYSTSPETKKKKGIRGFGLGRDKDKDKEKDKGTANDIAASGTKSGAGMSRHERTISQILREADAVLQLDDFEGGSGNDDDDDVDDPAMFGTSSVDIEAGPTLAKRSTSRQF